MSKTQYINVTDARKNLFDIVEATQKSPLPIHLTLHGVPAAVIVSEEEYESWMATVETLSDPELMEGIQEAMDDLDEGRVVGLDDIKREMGILVKKEKHVVSDKAVSQSPKRSKKA